MNKAIKYRHDYQPSPYQIDTAHLTFKLGEDKTEVIANYRVRRMIANNSEPLILNGREQEFISAKINQVAVSAAEYELTPTHLTLITVPDDFELEIVSIIEPQNNTSLMGLYRSNGTFCTQCEAEGFGKITYFIERPDMLTVFTTTIIADKKRYPILLSNGNLLEQKTLAEGYHQATWHDPFKKSCHLFAMVAGDLAQLEDEFVTMSGRKVTLKIFAAATVIEQCQFALASLKKSMRWDEENYGREYDLDIFMIVAVNDFNFGAMENKGLNIFNDRYILANPQTATDSDYANIDAVIAHEYFHNWSGNRVTLRDWFQLSLKEGFTVFRDQSFSESIGSREVERIHQVQDLRATQFVEDAGPLAHPVRPDAYSEINNFYTSTVYEKGAELIRMLRAILGEVKYRQGTDLYFEKNDGKAVTCDDFVAALQTASGIDLTQFKRWYSQSGTPQLTITDEYQADKQQYILQVAQYCPPSPQQPTKLEYFMPLAVGLLNQVGEEIHVTRVFNLTQQRQTLVFENIAEKPIPSLLRGFSAPVKLFYDYSDQALAILMAHDTDGVARWEAGQNYLLKTILLLVQQYQQNQAMLIPELFFDSFAGLLQVADKNPALIAEMLMIPEESFVAERLGKFDVAAICAARHYLKQQLAEKNKSALLDLYHRYHTQKPYEYTVNAVAARSLKNTCLNYLMLLVDPQLEALCEKQFNQADNMTDQYAALLYLARLNSPARTQVIEAFYQQWRHDPLVIDKWFSAQVLAQRPTVLEEIKALLAHPDFNLKNPNKVRAVLGALPRNIQCFHRADGKAYQLLTEYVLMLDKINPMVASRLVTRFSSWQDYVEPQASLMKAELIKLADQALSSDVKEIVEKSLQ